jgi:ssDNA thymidine ADP-ribosyltransferase, DarT
MTAPPERPKIYHITHVDNLPPIVADGGLVSDREMLTRGGPARMIGMSDIKRRRVEELDVHCHPGTKVGDYVPFFFCPRSIMLYVISMQNHPELTYRGGQGPIVHLEADLHDVIRWADAEGRRWAFSLSNAGAWYAEFRLRVEELSELDWDAIGNHDFRDARVKEGKQAEFLLHERFPFDLVTRIGVRSVDVQTEAVAAIAELARRPPVEVRPQWYY